MKVLITTAFLSLCALASNAQSKFSISGNVPGLTDSAILIATHDPSLIKEKLLKNQDKNKR